jgi:perosamine synthetase
MAVIPVYSPALTEDDARAVRETTARGDVSANAPSVEAFERLWASRCGMPHGVAVSNGTAALELAVRALSIGPGDEVICPAFTIISCARAIVMAGAIPVLVDVDPETYCIDVGACRTRLGPRTRAVLAVHLYGHPYDHAALSALAAQHGFRVIEDAAEAHGATVRDANGTETHVAGSLGDVSTFSFYANKPITTGEGGMVLARDEEVRDRLRELRNLGFGSGRRFVHDELAPNYRLSGVQAALGVSQLARLDAVIRTKRRIAAEYRARLARIDEFELQHDRAWADPIYWMIAGVLRDDAPLDAALLGKALAERGVETRPFFAGMHEQPALRALGLFEGERYPVTERLARRGLYLPSGLDLDADAIDRVATALEQSLVAARQRSRAAPTSSRGDAIGSGSPSERPPASVATESSRGRPALRDSGSSAESSAPSARGAAFGPLYAEAYDSLYADKDYGGEVTTIVQAFERYGTRPVKDVLDLGCGTGRHAVRLAERGYDVVGVDRSPSMLAVARAASPANATFVEADMTELDLGRRFDAALILFAALGYETTVPSTIAALRVARRHLPDGGLLVFDIWYGPSVAMRPPTLRTKTVRSGAVEWTRRARPLHDPHSQSVRIAYELTRRDASGERRASETHTVRYFFPAELELVLAAADFDLVCVTGYDDFGPPPRLDDYSALVVARARAASEPRSGSASPPDR